MAPLDPEQRAEVLEMTKSGLQESHAATEKALIDIRATTNKGHEDMRVTTEIEIKAQRAHNLEVETKLLELTKNIEAQITALRVEFGQSETAVRIKLGTEFDNAKQNAAELRGLVAELQVQKQNIIDGVDKQLRSSKIRAAR